MSFLDFFKRQLGEEGKEQSPRQTANQELPLLDDIQVPALQKIAELNVALLQEGIRVSEEVFLTSGCSTNEPRLMELFSLMHENRGTTVVQINVEEDFSFQKAMQQVYQSVFQKKSGDLSVDDVYAQIFGDLTKKVALVIYVNPLIAKQVNYQNRVTYYTNRDITIFQNKMRHLQQHSRVPMCVYCEDERAIPVELSINLRFIRKKS